MCDTFYFKDNNKRYFMKNSDRGPNEPNLIRFYPRENHKEKELKCTYITIPQVKETYATILVQPSWIYGAEMGVNEFYVSIGNEAVFTKNKDQKTERLIGMDYLRLALERSKSALDAAHTIIDLLKVYGQGGNCGFDHNFYYDNSYLIMDKKETYILETVGKEYCLYKADNSYNISNKLSINKEYIESSKEFKDFENENIDFFFTTGSMSKVREKNGKCLLNSLSPSMKNALDIISHHRLDKSIKGDVGSICMHKNMLGDHTTSSIIVDYNKEEPTIWLNGSPSPCISIFKPYYFGLKTDLIKETKEESLEYYYKRMYLNRLVLSGSIDYRKFHDEVYKINLDFFKKDDELKERTEESLIKFMKECNDIEEKFISKYDSMINDLKYGNIKIKGIFNKLTKNLSSNPFSTKLYERIK